MTPKPSTVAVEASVLPVPRGGRLILSPHPATRFSATIPDTLAFYRQQGAKLMLTLVSEPELDSLGLGELGACCQAVGLAWEHCPIDDFSAPDSAFTQAWQHASPRIHGLLDAGHGVVIHCRAGLGRTGTVAAQLLIERGMLPDQAMAAVRRVRPGSIETLSQETYLRSLRLRPEATNRALKLKRVQR